MNINGKFLLDHIYYQTKETGIQQNHLILLNLNLHHIVFYITITTVKAVYKIGTNVNIDSLP